MLDQDRAQATLAHVVGLLSAGDYDGLERLSAGRHLSADYLREAVADYGGTVLPSPFELHGPEPYDDGLGWFAEADLYTAEEGRSDLTLSVSLQESDGPLYVVELNELHVL